MRDAMRGCFITTRYVKTKRQKKNWCALEKISECLFFFQLKRKNETFFTIFEKNACSLKFFDNRLFRGNRKVKKVTQKYTDMDLMDKKRMMKPKAKEIATTLGRGFMIRG